MSTPNQPHRWSPLSKEPDLPLEEPETDVHQPPSPQSQAGSTDINTVVQLDRSEGTNSGDQDHATSIKPLPLRFKTSDLPGTFGTMPTTTPSADNYRVEKAPTKSSQEQKEEKRALLRNVAQVTLKTIPVVVEANSRGSRYSYLITEKLTPPLQTSNHSYPDIKNTHVKVVNSDTLDAALALHNAYDIFESEDDKAILVLNFANAEKPGGGWKNGAMAQEEAICYRSTLSATLKEHFYPMAERQSIYSPGVIVFRENVDRGHSFMWTDKPTLLPVVAVVSMAATDHPLVDKSVLPFKYKHDSERILMEDKMRMILRLAGGLSHRRLVLGAIGCGVFAHPVQEVANCWKKVLQEDEFKGWFEMVLFAVLDWSDTLENFRTFKDTLHNLEI